MLLVMRVLSIVPLNFKASGVSSCVCGVEKKKLKRVSVCFWVVFLTGTASIVVGASIQRVASVQFVCSIVDPSTTDVTGSDIAEHASPGRRPEEPG